MIASPRSKALALTEYEADVLAMMPPDSRVFDLERVRAALRLLTPAVSHPRKAG